MSEPTLPALELYIDGRWRAGGSGKSFDVTNPATGDVIGRLPLASDADVDAAIDAAARAFPLWRDTAPAERSVILTRAVALIRQHADHLAWLTTVEQGMVLRDARALTMRAAEFVEWDIHEGQRLFGRIVPGASNVRQSVLRESFGVVAAFSPWNGAVLTPCRKIGSALAAGCSIVLKPAEETPFSAIALVHLFEEAGVPPGLINLVYGDPAAVSSRLIRSPHVQMVSFTGSIPVGKHLAGLCASEMKPSIMELGGHAPVLVCADADLEATAQRLVDAKFFNAGQVCIAPSRAIVDAKVYERFLSLVEDRVRKIVVGDGLDPSVTMGPLANERRLAAVDELIKDAIKRGARLVIGGERIGNVGCYYAPTVLVDVPKDARVLSGEPFGPVLTVNPMKDLSAGLEVANALPYGLAAYAFTRSAETVERISRALESGMVGINHFGVSAQGIPFGGIKNSGHGREGGSEGVLAYTYGKTVVHRFD